MEARVGGVVIDHQRSGALLILKRCSGVEDLRYVAVVELLAFFVRGLDQFADPPQAQPLL